MPEKLELKNGQKHDFDVSWKNDKVRGKNSNSDIGLDFEPSDRLECTFEHNRCICHQIFDFSIKRLKVAKTPVSMKILPFSEFCYLSTINSRSKNFIRKKAFSLGFTTVAQSPILFS